MIKGDFDTVNIPSDYELHDEENYRDRSSFKVKLLIQVIYYKKDTQRLLVIFSMDKLFVCKVVLNDVLSRNAWIAQNTNACHE